MTLEDWAAPALPRLPLVDSTDEPLRLSGESLPAPSNCMSDRIVVERSAHWMPNSRHDRVDVFADKQPLAFLGLLIFASIFHEGDQDIELSLTNPASEVRTIRVERAALRRDSSSDVVVRPLWYDYGWVCDDEEIARHPLLGSRDVDLRLTNQSDMVFSEQDLDSRDVVCGFGNLSGTTQLAELLLNLSRPWITRSLVDLEGPPGFESVAASSAWLRICMPGDDMWPSQLEGLVG